jgi:hypothetical protein
LLRPYSWNFFSVHSLARWHFSDPVSRGPIMSERYSRFSITWDFARSSVMIRRSVSSTSGVSVERADGPCWLKAIPPARAVVRSRTGMYKRMIGPPDVDGLMFARWPSVPFREGRALSVQR